MDTDADDQPQPVPEATPLASSPGPAKTDHVLVITLGSTPTILTNLVWALATQGLGPATPPLIPSRIHVICRQADWDHFDAQIVKSGVWGELLEDIGARCGGQKIQIPIGKPTLLNKEDANGIAIFLDDMRTAEDLDAAGNCIQSVLQGYPDNPIIACLSGGRKSLGALLYGAMTLVAKGNDTLVHIIASGYGKNGADYETRSPRDFYYSGQRRPIAPAPEFKPDVRPADILESICILPFVPVGHFYKVGKNTNFTDRVRSMNRLMSRRNPVHVVLRGNSLYVEDIEIDLSEWIDEDWGWGMSQEAIRRHVWRDILIFFLRNPPDKRKYQTGAEKIPPHMAILSAFAEQTPGFVLNKESFTCTVPSGSATRRVTFKENTFQQAFSSIRQKIENTLGDKELTQQIFPSHGRPRSTAPGARPVHFSVGPELPRRFML